MDVQKYINSGILEEYCLGLLNEEEQSFLIQMTMLYPEVKEELIAVELMVEELALVTAVKPSRDLKKNILSKLGFDPDTLLDLSHLPAVDDNTDHQTWLNALDHLIPADPSEDFLMQEIRKDEQYQQMLVVTKNNVPEEEHGDFIESFFILKGKCECKVGNELHKLAEGDFLEIPLHVKHDIKITSPYVIAVLQYRFV